MLRGHQGGICWDQILPWLLSDGARAAAALHNALAAWPADAVCGSDAVRGKPGWPEGSGEQPWSLSGEGGRGARLGLEQDSLVKGMRSLQPLSCCTGGQPSSVVFAVGSLSCSSPAGSALTLPLQEAVVAGKAATVHSWCWERSGCGSWGSGRQNNKVLGSTLDAVLPFSGCITGFGL